jgi:imidazolonepropionase-like amidohydrolase
MARLSAFAAWLLALLVFPAGAEIRVLKNFTLIDGTDRPPAPASAMIIDNGRIRWIGPVSNLKPPASAEVVDLTGAYVMPGIVNLHGHIGNTIDLEQNARFFTRENIEQNLKTYASYGVTAVLSMGTDQDLIFKIRDEQRTGRPSMARVYTAGQGFIYKGGYGGLPGVNAGVTGVAEVKGAVEAQARKKVDIIKLWIDDHLGDQKPKMPYEIARAIIGEAHRQKLRVAAHVFYLEDARELLSYGVDGLAHSVRDRPLDNATVERMKKQGTWQIAPTLSREASLFAYATPAAFLDDPFFIRGISAKAHQTLKSPAYQTSIRSDPHFSRYPEFLETAKKNLKMLADAGVRYGFGTDTGPPGRFPGHFEHWEMELMVDYGMKPLDVLKSSTSVNADVFGYADKIGRIKKGLLADIIAVKEDPTINIKTLEQVKWVMKDGIVYKTIK